MNIEELAFVFDGLAKGLAGGLKEKEKKELNSLERFTIALRTSEPDAPARKDGISLAGAF